MSHNHFAPTCTLRPQSPPFIPRTKNPNTPSETSSDHFPDSISILSLNGYNKLETTLSLLNTENKSIIFLQEPGLNCPTLLAPSHPNWHSYLDFNHTPIDFQSRHRTCTLIHKSIPIQQIHPLPGGCRYLSAFDINLNHPRHPFFRFINLYNKPTTFDGIPLLQSWLQNFNNRKVPTFIFMDSNLHHSCWNPANYHHTHPQSKTLLKICGQNGFKIISEKHVPTFITRNGTPTTIDLIWANHTASSFVGSCSTISENHNSDHQALKLELNFSNSFIPPTRKVLKQDFDIKKFQNSLTTSLSHLPVTLNTSTDADNFATSLTESIQLHIDQQSRTIKDINTKSKPWWNKMILNPIVKNRNRARRWMLMSKTPESVKCYTEWQHFFKFKLFELKKNHWRKFLAESHHHQIFTAYKFTKPSTSGTIAPLLDQDNNITSVKAVQAQLLFNGTSNVPITSTLEDIPPENSIFNTNLNFPQVQPAEIKSVICNLKMKKAPGPDHIKNEYLIWSADCLSTHLSILFNFCFSTGYFPKMWKHATTSIIRKANKDSYADPSSYRPIALLSCLGKIFESVITKRITHWAETNNVLAPGHFGGRAGRCTTDANLFLNSWIHKKWRERKVVAALFLDVKSAFPSLLKDRLTHTLRTHNCPEYLFSIIHSLLSDRTTSLRLENYLSDPFNLNCGLPQGSPLSPILYIIYNSSLLSQNPLQLKQDQLSLGFIDDVVHLSAHRDTQSAINILQQRGSDSLQWGASHNAIFDKKKACFMLFTHRKADANLSFQFGGLTLPRLDFVKYLGILFDSKLKFHQQYKKIKQTGNSTIQQLYRINRCSFGLDITGARNLITSVLFPRISYGAAIWYSNKYNSNKFSKMLQVIQNQAVRLILGLFSSTPSTFLQREAPINSITSVIIKQIHSFYIKRLSFPPNHPTHHLVKKEINIHPAAHSSSIHRTPGYSNLQKLNFNFNKIEKINPHLIPPW